MIFHESEKEDKIQTFVPARQGAPVLVDCGAVGASGERRVSPAPRQPGPCGSGLEPAGGPLGGGGGTPRGGEVGPGPNKPGAQASPGGGVARGAANEPVPPSLALLPGQ